VKRGLQYINLFFSSTTLPSSSLYALHIMARSYTIPFLPENIPIFVQFIAAGLILSVFYFVYSTLTSERPWPGFPVM